MSSCPLFEEKVPAGFPSPAENVSSQSLDLHELMVKHPAATFFIRVEGESMEGAGIKSGDLLVVDRAVKPRDGMIVVALVNGEFTVKRLKMEIGRCFLIAAHPNYPPLAITEAMTFEVWGVVTYVIHRAC